MARHHQGRHRRVERVLAPDRQVAVAPRESRTVLVEVCAPRRDVALHHPAGERTRVDLDRHRRSRGDVERPDREPAGPEAGQGREAAHRAGSDAARATDLERRLRPDPADRGDGRLGPAELLLTGRAPTAGQPPERWRALPQPAFAVDGGGGPQVGGVPVAALVEEPAGEREGEVEAGDHRIAVSDAGDELVDQLLAGAPGSEVQELAVGGFGHPEVARLADPPPRPVDGDDAHACSIGRSLLAGIPGSLTLTPAPLGARYSPGYPARSRSRGDPDQHLRARRAGDHRAACPRR